MQINFLNIQQIYPHKTAFISYPTKIMLNQQLSSDTVCFKGKKDLLDLPDKDIFEKINKTKSDSRNFLGEGGEACVFRIPDTDYCVRFSFDDYDYISNTFRSYKETLDRTLSEGDKINHVVAKFGNASSIRHYIEGTPVINSIEEADFSKSLLITEEIIKMPIKSYNQFLKQICYAYNNDMMFDAMWQNVIINPKKKTITAIDFYKNEYNEPLSPLCHMYNSLVHPQTRLDYRKIIANKILNAAIDEFKPTVAPCWSITDFDFTTLLSLLKFKYNLQVDMAFIKSFNKVMDTITDLKNKEIKGSNVTLKLEANIKKARKLINQIL